MWPPRWYWDGLCRGVGSDLFFSSESDDVAEAKRVCASCPVLLACRAHGLRFEADGVWGGLSGEERRARRQRRRYDVDDQLGRAMANEGNWTTIGRYSKPRTASERASVISRRRLPPGHWAFAG